MSITFMGDSFEEPISSVQIYSDGTPMIKTDRWESIVDNAHTVVIKPRNLMDFYTGLMLVDAVNVSGGWIKKLVLPYLPGARQDRSNPTGDVLFTADSIARDINTRKFSSVVVLDPHSPVMPGKIRNLHALPLSRVAVKVGGNEYDGIIAPDKGAKKRAEEFARTLGVPVFYGGKTRDVSTGKLTGFTLDRLPSSSIWNHYSYRGRYLVVDDICDGGGTFVGLGEKIREQGATADLYVSHGIFSKGTDDLKNIYRNIYTTDSREQREGNDVNVIKIVKQMVRL